MVPHDCYPDTWWLTGDRDTEAEIRAGEDAAAPLFGISDDGVVLAIHWSDNRYDHGAYLLHWLLERHACTGQESEYGSSLDDNAAIIAELARWELNPTAGPPARRQWVSRQLDGLVVGRVILTPLEMTLCLVDQDSFDDRFLLTFSDETATMDDPDLPPGSGSAATLVTTLYEWLPTRIISVSWDEDGSLCLTLGTGATTLRLAASWPGSATGWALAGPSGDFLVQSRQWWSAAVQRDRGALV